MDIQLSLLPMEVSQKETRKRAWCHPVHFLFFMHAFLSFKVKAREYQLAVQKAHNAELLTRLQYFQDEVQWLSNELKQAEKASAPPKKRVRVYKRKCVNCSETFDSKSFDRNYCDQCRSIGEQRRRGFNRGKNKLK